MWPYKTCPQESPVLIYFIFSTSSDRRPVAGSNQNRGANSSKQSTPSEKEKWESWKRFHFYIQLFVKFSVLFRSRRLFSVTDSFLFIFSLACRQIRPPSCTLTLFKRFSSFVDEKRNYLALERNCPRLHGLFYSVSDSLSSHLTFFCPNLSCIGNFFNRKGITFQYLGTAFIFNLNKIDWVAVFGVQRCLVSTGAWLFLSV